VTLRRTSGIIIPKDYLNIDEIKTDLTRTVINWDETTKQVKFYEELNTSDILIPRYYKKINDKIIDESDEGEIIDIESKVIPRNERQRKAIDEFTKRNDGILRLEPGTGKTVIATSIISHYKRRTIIFAHKDKLLDQWKDELLKHTTIKESEIGRLSSQNYKECFKKSIILSTPHIILYAISNNKEDFLRELQNANIGILIIDECHVGIGPEQFSKSSIFIKSKRTYGLSATPYRSDGTSDLLDMHLGPVIYYPPEENELLKPLVFMTFLPFRVFKNSNYFMYGGKFQLSRYYTQMYKSDFYNNKVSQLIKKSFEKDRTILILGKNIKPLLTLAKACQLPKESVGIFIPGAVSNKTYKKMVLDVSDTLDLMESFYSKKIVFSTYGACRDGNNRKDLDMLVMSCPTTNPEQAVGRVLRQLEDKKQPIVIDLVDIEGPSVYSKLLNKKVSWFVRSAYLRYQFYKSKDWTVKFVNLDAESENYVKDLINLFEKNN